MVMVVVVFSLQADVSALRSRHDGHERLVPRVSVRLTDLRPCRIGIQIVSATGKLQYYALQGKEYRESAGL